MTRRILAIAALALAATLSPAHAQSETYRVTGYCETGLTRSSTPVRLGVVAVDPAVIPLGSHLYIDGLAGEFVAEDTGSGIRGAWIDVWFQDCQQALNWGVQYREVTVWP